MSFSVTFSILLTCCALRCLSAFSDFFERFEAHLLLRYYLLTERGSVTTLYLPAKITSEQKDNVMKDKIFIHRRQLHQIVDLQLQFVHLEFLAAVPLVLRMQ